MSFINYLSRNKLLYQKIFVVIIILTGTVVRIAVYLQNRNLFIDEANIARNIYERGFGALALPLSYEQYAPPVFMWMLKLSSLLFGFSEFALRIWPLLAGIASLVVLVLVLKELTSFKSLWYPLFLMTVAYIFIRYSSELKQYMPDVLITLSLILYALKTQLRNDNKLKFILTWVVAGSIAIWASMPSVFILAGVGAYYITDCIRQRTFNILFPIIIVGMAWMAQFAFYYFTILKPQANTNYLQGYHSDYFIFGLPKSKDQFMHNWYLFKGLLEEAGGYAGLAWKFNIVLFVLGSVMMLWKQTARGVLVLVPIAGTLFAAALHQYSLIPRVALFMMPLLLILVGCGLDYLMKARFLPWQLLLIWIAAVNIKTHSMLRMMNEPMKNEEITESMKFLEREQVTGSELYVNNGACPAFIYYTQIHPAHTQWGPLAGAKLLAWDANYDTIAKQVTTRAAFLYSAIGKDELDHYKTILTNRLSETAHVESEPARTYAYIYEKKQ